VRLVFENCNQSVCLCRGYGVRPAAFLANGSREARIEIDSKRPACGGIGQRCGNLGQNFPAVRQPSGSKTSGANGFDAGATLSI
jgi:hypothetical protein